MLEVRGLIVTTSRGPIVDELNFRASSPGLLSIVGPGGAGKSTLLRAVAGELEGLEQQGQILLDGIPTSQLPEGSIGWFPQYIWQSRVGQGPRSAAQRQIWSGGRVRQLLAFFAEPRAIYVLDEPTAGLTDTDGAIARQAIHAASLVSLVLMVTHNRADCMAAGGEVMLFVAGQLVEQGTCQQLFENPRTEAARHYVETGYIAMARQRRPVTIDGIWCLERGLLYGMSRPGLVAGVAAQYSRLRDCGVRHMVCLEESMCDGHEDAALFGIALYHVPVVDMRAPSHEQAVQFCEQVEGAIRAGEGVVFHCKGGLGRTGTALACSLIWLGEKAAQAIAKVRSACPLAIQSEEQMAFIHQFADRVRCSPSAAAAFVATIKE